MKRIGFLRNKVQEYAWGSFTAIPELLGNETVFEKPQAELWMGAHPKAPSKVRYNERTVSLLEFIDSDPSYVLGEKAAKKFEGKLPFLLKVLAAEKPLSIQAHPNISQAKGGFKRENELKIDLSAPNRNYKDDNHKPECICALTPFWALNGFRRIQDTLLLMTQICPNGLGSSIKKLKNSPDHNGLKIFFEELITIEQMKRRRIIDEAVKNSERLTNDDPIFQWIIKLHEAYPDDMGIFAPIILNLICLEPGQAMFLHAGELHAYLYGVGMELMANSDNVLRGGLTPKHVDVQELLKVLKFKEKDINILLPDRIRACEGAYHSEAEEFVLSVISIDRDNSYHSPDKRSAEILICTEGEAEISDIEIDEKGTLFKGTSVIVPAAVNRYSISGAAILYKAAVPI